MNEYLSLTSPPGLSQVEIRESNQARFPECFTACPACDHSEPCPLCLGTGLVTRYTAEYAESLLTEETAVSA